MDPITLMAIAGGVGSLLSTLKGTHDAAKQNKRTEQLIKGQLAQAEADRKAVPNNYLDTLEGKTIATQAGEQLRQAAKAVNNNAIKTGATNEQRLAQASSYQDAYNKLMQNLSAKSTQNTLYYDALLRDARNKYLSGQIAINNQKAQSDVNSGIGMANAIGNLATAGIQTYGMKNNGKNGTNISDNSLYNFNLKNYKVTPKDINRANDMYLGNNYLRKYLQYR